MKILIKKYFLYLYPATYILLLYMYLFIKYFVKHHVTE